MNTFIKVNNMIYAFVSLSGPQLFWLIAAIAVAAALLGGFFFLLYVAKRVFDGTLVRENEDTWGYECSCPENPEQMQMWDEGVAWAEENKDRMKEVDITSRDGLCLHGQFYDFGGENAVIFLPGRCECLLYSCYFAKPWADMGFSVLAIDVRCHGKSEGKYSSIGKGEGEDAAEWARFLSKEFGIKNVWFHGICLGCSAAFYASTMEGSPDVIKGIVAEGPYVTFRETYYRHLLHLKKPVWPLVDLIMWRIKAKTGVSYRTVAPIRLVKEYDKHILYIYGEKDVFSIPKKSKKLFAATKSETKSITWLPKGSHSHLRVNNEKEYDKAIVEYVTDGK